MRPMLSPRPLVASLARIPFFAGLDETTGLPVSDTDTANDWANYTNDSVEFCA